MHRENPIQLMEQFAGGKATRTRRNCYRYMTVERVKCRCSFFFPLGSVIM